MLVVALLAAVAAPLRGDGMSRYEAVFSDGTRLEGTQVTDWGGHAGPPRLDNTSLQDPKRPLRWLRDRSLQPWRASAERGGYIEFVGGDRIVGRVIGAHPSSESGGIYTPAHLLVIPAEKLQVVPHRKQPKPVRVLIGSIRRIVMAPTSSRRCPPGSLLQADGRRVDFVGIRAGDDSLRLLVSDGTLKVRLANVARVHFPRIDPWDAYFRALAILSPACRSRLVRFETTGGLIATGSELRFRALPYSTQKHQQRALDHIKRLDANLAKLQKASKENTEKFDKARAEYTKQSAELDKRIKAVRQASEKARSDLQRGIDQQKKKDADQLTEKRRKIDREFKSADEATVKRLAAEKPEKRAAVLKAFRLRQAQLRKTRTQAVETERARLGKQRQKELADSVAREIQKLKRLETDHQKQSGQLKRKFATATALWERHSRSINHARLQRTNAKADGSITTWQHVIQPVWSLDALQVPFARICMWWSFAPDRVPLSRVHPTKSVTPPLQPWRINRNAEGKLFHSGGRQYGWGFGVHAYSELNFTLPRFANSFQARLGLDSIVAGGGCVRARVFGGDTTGKPLYESGLLIGSKKTVDTGPIAIGSPAKGPKRLILQADTAHRDRPRGTDPLNIRDKLDWLDPVIGFDPAVLQDAIHRRAVKQLHPWKGWAVNLDKRGAYTWTSQFRRADWPEMSDFVTVIRAEKHPLVLSREITVGPRDNWITVDTGTFEGGIFRPEILSLRIDKKNMTPELIPVRQEWQKRDAPPAFAIGAHRGKKITIDLTQPAGTDLYWRAARIADKLPGEYRLASVLKTAGNENMKVPMGLGWALQSDAVNDSERLALLEIHRLGGTVNFWNPSIAGFQPNQFNNVLIGHRWTGGDKAFATLSKLGCLKSLLLAGDAGISAAAVEKLKGARPDLIVRPFDRTPSGLSGSCHMVIKNLTGKDIVVHWADFSGKLSRPRKMKPGANAHQRSAFGCRYEVHIDEKLVETYYVVPVETGKRAYVVWEIKPR
jgi:hypothetical protein